jgi:ATP-binding cassette subfamily C protein LapB
LAEDQDNETNQKNGLLVEAIDGIESIKAVGGEWKMLEHWKQLTQKTASKELTSRSITSFATSASQTVQQLSYVLMVAIGAYAVGSGKITMGALMACSIISNRALSPIAQIASKIVQWQSAKAALKGLDEMMKLPVDTQDGMEMTILEDMQGKIQLDQVAFAYQGNQVVFKHPQLVIKPGERVAIIGTIGSGKSTLIKLLSGLYKPTEGKVFLDDVDMHHISPVFLRESIGYLTQDIRLFNGTLRYNLTIGLQSPSDSKILSACEKTGLIQIIKQHPKGLDLPIFEGGRGLSGGQRQLVGLTRMLLLKPKILLLDEPTASIDGELEQTILKVLFTEADPQSVILLSTHKLALLKYVERVIVLDRGKIRFDGPRAEVIAKLKGQP